MIEQIFENASKEIKEVCGYEKVRYLSNTGVADLYEADTPGGNVVRLKINNGSGLLYENSTGQFLIDNRLRFSR